MRPHKTYILYTSVCLWLLTSPLCIGNLQEKDLVIIIGAGHDDHDSDAIGEVSRGGNISLNVALKLGNLAGKNCNDVKVVYARNRDTFIPLDRQVEIVNDIRTDLFISAYTNVLAKNRTARRASIWTLGLVKPDTNLEIAKQENSIILYESDYQTRYAGFNPDSAESYIIFELMQDKYMEQNVHLISLVQKQSRRTRKRADHGVCRAGFPVLRASAMPSILVELGFILTPEEKRYLSSEVGASTMAEGIYRAFLDYKGEQGIHLTGTNKTIIPAREPVTSTPERRELMVEASTISTTATETIPRRSIISEGTTNDNRITFRMRILTSSKPFTENDRRLKGPKDVSCYKGKGLYEYAYSASNDYNKVLCIKRTISTQFKDAFAITFRNNERMNINETIVEFRRRRNK